MNRSGLKGAHAHSELKLSLLTGAGLAALATAQSAHAFDIARTGERAASPALRVDASVETSLRYKPVSRAKLNVSSAASSSLILALAGNTVGATVVNPVTGNNEVVVEVISTNVVRTNAGNVIILADEVGDTFVELAAASGSGSATIDFNDPTTTFTWKVTAVTKDGSGRVISLDLERVDDTTITRTGVARVADVSGRIAGQGTSPGSDGTGTSGGIFAPAAGDVNTYEETSFGADGGDGADGGGVRICVPVLGCATIGKNPQPGGDGAPGGNINATVTTANNGDITVVSHNLPGIAVISAGGDGGQGGDSYASLNLPAARGGAAGPGGNVTLVADVQITTSGIGSHGIFAQSMSGTGGAGGSGYGITGGGGGGGTAGQGGNVSVDNRGDILTTGTGAIGIFAQSLGGSAGGGGGGFGIVAEGGGGSVGGNGGSVSVTHSGNIETRGILAYGILAQSIGGGGGNAGTSGGVAAFGDDGGAGGTGANVTVTTTSAASVVTQGLGSHAIFAQSIGGGGGSGGTSGGLVALGSAGSAGGDAGTVSVTNGGLVSTSGDFARGLFAQSIGGGGGSGGSSGGLVSIGGSGGKASTGGIVTVSNTGDITTGGNFSAAIMAQSIGGGGGDGGSSGGAFLTIGGRGGDGGASSQVTINHSGDISTTGNDSQGIFVQSVGGGGGNGGASGSVSAFAGVAIGGDGGKGGNGGLVDVNFSDRTVGAQTFSPLIFTGGDRSTAVFAQSVGGGGGNGGWAAQVSAGYGVSASIAIGGGGGEGGLGGTVNVDGDVNIVTLGDNSSGLFAQSVGGGGGNGGFATSFSFAAGETAAAAFSVGVGGTGGDGGAGGQVNIDSGGAITTAGDFATGLVGQSVGGGGGNGGFSVSFAGSGAGVASASVAVGVGGSAGSGNTGGTVDVDFDGTITTTGDDSGGALIQSVGGGGGNGGFNISGAVSGAGTVGAGVAIGVGGEGGAAAAGGTTTGRVGGAVSTAGDRSTGITIQSVGGGGGNGGFNVSGAIGGGGSVGAAVSVGVGGAGGGGGSGGTVTGTAGSTVTTTGNQSSGLVVQSVGGGGGNGGFNVSAGIGGGGTFGGALQVGVGGAGGGGGDGGNVTGSALGHVSTSGQSSSGVVVQSLGGGGGNGGFNVSAGIGGGGTFGGNLGVGVGGSGDFGGQGGNVTGSAVSITTAGESSTGFLAQSVGGGGGNGGFNVSGGIGGGGTAGVALSVGVGGSGGGGGNAGNVTGTVTGHVDTTGDLSSGVVVQSLGGGGGNGGFNVSGGIGGGGTFGGALSVGIGGSAAGGGDGGEVDASSVSVTTRGDSATAFLAQSVGGGGGNGGFTVAGGIGGGGTAAGSISVGIGGSGGGGGNAARVGATVTGNVFTQGEASSGIVAQSLGGGGGNGGFSIAGGIAGAGTGAVAINVGIGGSGGDGGNSGNVRLDATGWTATEGDLSDGVVVQSVGGGGGNGGFNISGGVALAKSGAGTIGFGLGGSGGGGGNSGTATAYINQGIANPGNSILAARTLGDNARAIVVQSLGGGGGNGGFNITGGISAAKSGAGNIGVGIGGSGGAGGDAAAAFGGINGDVFTLGAESTGLLVQSVGGGGGNGGFNITGGISASKDVSGNIMVGIGGAGEAGGDAGSATGFLTGDVITAGERASAVTYQSLGGGGGNGAFNITGAVSLSAGGGTGSLGVGVGGFGGDGGDGALVDASVTGDILTFGNDAHGVLLQSLGGGGGNGGFNITGSVSASKGAAGTLGVGVGGFGGAGGSASTVNGTLTGDVTTSGANSFGAMLQSLGGAGGNGGMNITGAVSLSVSNNAAVGLGVGIGGFAGSGGNSGDVTGTITGDYTTSGDNGDGIIAQSIGGGGGNGGMNITGAVALSGGTAGTGAVGIGGFGADGGNSGAVSLTYAGDVRTDGANADGVVVQSLAGGGGNGGINISGGVSGTTKGSAASLGFGLGGFGGGGGDAGNVTASVTGNVWAQGLESDITTPEQVLDLSAIGLPGQTITIEATRERLNGSHGVVAQSLGGGGGNGALNITGQISITQPGSPSVSSRAAAIGIGGFGGDGGDAGTVDLTIGAPGTDRVQVQAAGDDRNAVIAQSLGGGGGNGGINISGGVAMDGTLTVGVGGFGGAGGLGRDVTADVDADLFASGHRSRGLAAQSIGGGGGNGGINISGGITGNTAGSEPAIAFGLGGFGGAGNSSGNVNVDHNGQIMVDGIDAIGLLAQSVAGGGGSGGLNVTGTLNLTGLGSTTGSSGYAASVDIGGTGGTGADAGQVTVESTGNIIINGRLKASPTPGEDPFEAVDFTGGATGLLAQSIGGGGGTGGMNMTGTFAPVGNPISVGVGGSGGSGGNAGSVTVARGLDGGVASPGLIRTFGDNSTGLMAQSVGGGGGNAGMNFNLAAAVGTKTNDPVAALITVGGSGAGAGSGDLVAVTHVGNIVTDGRYSTGLHAQSVGGGGGNANFNIGAGLLKDATSLNFALGGATGAGGFGGAVTVDHTGTIVTLGFGAAGIKAQSIGGGGGNTGTDFNMSLLAKNSLDIVIGRLGGTGGQGGDVSVTAAGLIDTTGDESSGIFAQSIGGGGGASSATSVGGSVGTQNDETYAANVAVGLEGGIGAIAGNVSVTSSADIITRGRESRAIFAQSVGGGGGAGGTTTNIVLQATGAVTVGVGGTGGTGALGGRVDVTNTATLVTEGDRADGILAQSIGGGGGMGGMSITAGVLVGGVPDSSTSRTIAVNVGGSGGAGGDGGTVTVANSGIIATAGELSHGVRAQSVGGGGGIGGGVLNLRAQGKGNNQALDVNVGGSGNTGGSGGAVEVTNDGMIFTDGREAAGIFATSIGGGGGDAGTVINAVGGVSGSTNNSIQVAINIGGSGGLGGTGGNVTVSNLLADDGAGGVVPGSGQIVTLGEHAHGIFAQSLGGGGGNGSTVLSVTAMQSSENSFIGGFNLGGSGGSGNTAGTVSVTNEGLIDTTGDGAHGILAQSVGGGGGNGSMAIALNAALGARASSPLLAIGGFGGDGGDGGDVLVDNSGVIVTRGAGAHGIVAQSIGGGGGNASMAFGVTGEPVSLLLSNAVAAIAGAAGGGTGGTGGNVTVNHSGDITVLGDGSQAIKAESINGGGGTIALNFTGLVGFDNFPLVGPGSDPAVTDPTIQMRAGSADTSDMNAGNVTVNTTGTFGAAGDNGAGSFNQSVGGGGGTLELIAELSADAAGTSSASAGASTPQSSHIVPIDIAVTLGGLNGTNNSGADIASAHSGAIVTNGTNTPGVLIQTIGDGGGRAIIDINAPSGTAIGTLDLTLGSENGTNGTGGDITRTQSGSVTTTGDFSAGTILQSIGGGGGAIASRLQGAGAAGAVINAGLGADGGTGLSGGDVTASLSGGVTTLGDFAQGLLIQSIGAGGGEMRLNGGGSLNATLGGSNAAQGDGGAIALANSGTIYTEGARAHGVFLQSIGGGGGAVFGRVEPTSLTLSADNSGNGGAISFAQAGDIAVLGEAAYGLVAQSLGGGGGWVDGVWAGSAGGAGAGAAIDLAVSGDIMAWGENSVAVFAQSYGRDGAGNITGIFDGLIRGGSGLGAGLVLDGGADNTIVSSGSISAVSGLAISATSGNDLIENNGLVVGNIDLGSGENEFRNNAGATFIAFSTIDLRDPAGGGSGHTLPSHIAAVPAGAASADTSTFETSREPIAAAGAGSAVSPAGTGAVETVGAPASSEGAPLATLSEANPSAMASNDAASGVVAATGQSRSATPGGDASLRSTMVSREPVSSGEPSSTGEVGRVPTDIAAAMPASVTSVQAQSAPATLPAFAAPAAVTAPATFTNAGDFLMGLAAPRFPIDLANGDTFGNLDHVGDPTTNLLYGARVINTVELDGHFVQTASGHLAFDVAYGPYASDIVNVTGDATVDGTGEVILTWLENSDRVTLFATGGTGTDNGLDIFDTLAMDYSIEADDAGVHLVFTTDFGQPFLNRNGRALGRHMDSAIWHGDSGGIGRLMALIGNLRAGEEDAYTAIFTELNGEGHLAPLHSQYAGATSFAGDLFNCGTPIGGPEDQCVWARLETAGADRESSFENFGVDRNSMGFRGGFERRIDERWTLAAGIGYETIDTMNIDNGRMRTDGHGFNAGLGLERTSLNGVEIGGALSGGWQWMESARSQTIFEPGIGRSEPESGYLQFDMHIAKPMRGERLFVVPALNASATALHHAGFTEEGLDGIGYEGLEETEVLGRINPEIAFGAVLAESETSLATFTVTLGAVYHSEDRLELPLRFLGANPAADPAIIGTTLDQEAYRIEADLTIAGTDRVGLHFGYAGQFGEEAEHHRAGFDLRMRF